MAHKKAGGTAKNTRDSNPKMRGIKLYGGEKVNPGGIILRQKGSKYRAGQNVGTGKDFTLFALTEGVVSYKEKKVKKFDGRVFKTTFAEVKEVEKKEAK